MQIETTMSYHLTSIRMAIIKNKKISPMVARACCPSTWEAKQENGMSPGVRG
jgi:hypothetical protein